MLEGCPGAQKGQILPILTGQLGYRQSVVDRCLYTFYLDKEDSSGIDGIVAVATDDLLHGGGSRHLRR